MSDSWKLSLPCTRAEAEVAAAVEVDGAVLVATEEDEGAERWRLDAYFEGEPDATTLAAVRALVAGGSGAPERLPDQDWVTLSQAGLDPIREGRFFVHTAAHAGAMPPGAVAFRIEAGQAFGTGHHATTAGCLAMLEELAGERKGYRNIWDVGTGTGLLAFAAAELWPGAYVLATDIDPIAVSVSRENAVLNGIERVEFAVADGGRDLAVLERQEFDLVIANILAGPLIAMAGEITSVVTRGAAILLAGLLSAQADAVLAAYAAQGCAEKRRIERGDWTVLLLRAPEMAAGVANDAAGREDWTTDY